MGKTTLARCIAGQQYIQKGKIQYPILGESVGYDTRRRAIKFVSFTDTSSLFRNANAVHYYQQRFNAFDSDGHLTVRQYLETAGFSEQRPAHLDLLETIGIRALLDKERIKLSSGQTRKMLLARAILHRPKILILDNPYIGLDSGSRMLLNEMLDTLVEQHGMLLVIAGEYTDALPNSITHRLELENGQIQYQGTLATAVGQPKATPIDWESLNAIQNYFHRNSTEPTFEKAVALEHVQVRYGQTTIFENLNWEVLAGEKWALKGQNGSGKSTLLSLLYGDNPQAYANRIFLFDKRRGQGESIWDIKKQIGFTSSELHAYFDENYNARDVVLTGLFDGFAIRKQAEAQVLAFAKLLFRYFGIEQHWLQPYRELSTGTQRLLFFIRALIKVPPVLLLDEPFQGLDAPTIERCKLLLDTVLDERHTLIFITHFESEIPAVVDKHFELNG